MGSDGCHGPIGPERERRTGVQEGSEGVRRLDALGPDALLRPPPVVGRVVGLHRGDDADLGEAGDGRRAQVLGVLDAEPPVPRPVRRGHALVDTQEPVVGGVADGVHQDLEPRLVGRRGPRVQRVGRSHEEARSRWGRR